MAATIRGDGGQAGVGSAAAAAAAADVRGWAEQGRAELGLGLGLGPAGGTTTPEPAVAATNNISSSSSRSEGMGAAAACPAAPRRKSFAEALYRALHRLAPAQRPQILAVFRFLKQNSVGMTQAQVQPTLIAALGLDLVRAAWQEARREVEAPDAGAGAADHHHQAPPAAAQQQQQQQRQQEHNQQGPEEGHSPLRLRAGRRMHEAEVFGDGVEAEEVVDALGRRVRPRVGRQGTVMWRAGEGMAAAARPQPQQQHQQQERGAGAGGGWCPHVPPEPRPDEHDPHCPFYAAPAAHRVGTGALQALQQQLQHAEGQEGQGDEAAAYYHDDDEDDGAYDEGDDVDGEEDVESDLESVGSAATALSTPGFAAGTAPVVLLLARDEPELEDEEYLQAGAPDGFVCPISMRLLIDPVVAQDGFHYQRAALERWVARCHTEGRYPRSPLTNLPMAPWYLPSHTMKSMVQQYIERKRRERDGQQQEAEEEGEEEAAIATDGDDN